MIANHQLVAFRIASNQKRSDDRCAGRRAADHATAIEQVLQLAVRSSVEIRIGKAPLPAASEKDAARVLDRLHERVGVSRLPVARVKHADSVRAVVAEFLDARPIVVVRVVFASRGDDHNRRVFASGKLDEALDDGGILHVAADNHERAVLWPDLLGRGGGREREEKQDDRR